MIALDTNILVYARREETPFHREALTLLTELAEGDLPWALLWPVVYEYVRVVTHPRVFSSPSPVADVVEDLVALARSPSVVLLGEGSSHLSIFERTVLSSDVQGNLVHDAHIAALALEHGISDFLSCDRDFTRFRLLPVRNPFQD